MIIYFLGKVILHQGMNGNIVQTVFQHYQSPNTRVTFTSSLSSSVDANSVLYLGNRSNQGWGRSGVVIQTMDVHSQVLRVTMVTCLVPLGFGLNWVLD